jgi:NAD(P)-dependent dehydrogenase (short-subunit alcohol dehydrogenase family)
VEDFPPEKWDLIIAVNLSAAFHATRAAVPIMKRQGRGRIVNLASAHSLVASPFKSAYVAAKHGIAGFTKSVALEVAQSGITCNAISPGYVRTPLVENQIADTAKARGISEEAVMRDVLLAAQPTKRFVEYAELAGAAALPGLRRRGLRQRRQLLRGWGLDRRLSHAQHALGLGPGHRLDRRLEGKKRASAASSPGRGSPEVQRAR